MISRAKIPGAEKMMDSYSKIMDEAGLNPYKEQEDAQRKHFNDFITNARGGRVQGQGKFSRRYPASATGFQTYLADQTAYQLHQGKGGRMQDEQIARNAINLWG